MDKRILAEFECLETKRWWNIYRSGESPILNTKSTITQPILVQIEPKLVLCVALLSSYLPNLLTNSQNIFPLSDKTNKVHVIGWRASAAAFCNHSSVSEGRIKAPPKRPKRQNTPKQTTPPYSTHFSEHNESQKSPIQPPLTLFLPPFRFFGGIRHHLHTTPQMRLLLSTKTT